MRLCMNAVLVLLLALTWTRADPSPTAGSDPVSEKCSKLDILKNKTQAFGQFHFLAAFTDNNFFKTLLGLTSSVWYNVTLTQTGLSLTQFSKMNGTCLKSRAYVTITGDTGKVQMYGMMREFELLILSNTALIMDIRASTSNISSAIHKLHLDQSLSQGPNDVSQHAHSFYLISRGAEVSDTDLQRFKAYAKCEGFTGELDFLHKSDQGYCSEETSHLTTVDA